MSNKESPSKKRKRSANGEGTASKRTTHDFPKGKVKVTHLPKSDDWTPVVALAPGLALPPSASFQAFEKSSSKDSKQPELLLHSSNHSRINYTARTQHTGSDDDLLKHYVGVFDPSSNELKLVEAKRVSVRSSVRAEDEEMRVLQVAQSATLADRRRILGEEFGTKKAKKALNALKENAVTSSNRGTSPDSIAAAIKSDPSARAVLEAMAASSSGDITRESMQAAINADKPGPKPDPDATSIEEVYTAEALIGRDMLEMLKVKRWVEDNLAGKEVVTASRFVSTRVPGLVDQRQHDEFDAITRLKSCKYILVLLEFLGACKKEKSGGRKLPTRDKLNEAINTEPGVVQHVIKKFSKNGAMTKWQVDNIITHLCAISLLVDHWETDNYELREDIGLPIPDMAKYFLEIGVKVSSLSETERQRRGLTKAEASMHRMAKLRLPLELPKQRNIPRKKR